MGLIAKNKLILASLLLMAVFGASLIILKADKTPPPAAKPPTLADQPAAFDKQTHSIDAAASLWVVVNKGRKLPDSYRPRNLVVPDVTLRYPSTAQNMRLEPRTAKALEALAAAARRSGYALMLTSGFRSYDYQAGVYSSIVAQSGQPRADEVSARPGHSEHQTGLAADIEPASGRCMLDRCFADLPEGAWVAANAHKHGFIIRYQRGKQHLTGFDYEPWHLRFVGKPLAAELHASGQTMEQFFGLKPALDYPAKVLRLQ